MNKKVIKYLFTTFFNLIKSIFYTIWYNKKNMSKEIEESENNNIGIEIPIEIHFPEFKDHLDIENNKRILFSGGFASGKTYFLKKFFNDEEYKKKYKVIHLHPTNYQVSSNENIIDLIKLDILTEISSPKEQNKRAKVNKVKNSVFFKSLISIGKSFTLTSIPASIIKEFTENFNTITEESIKEKLDKMDKDEVKILIVDDLDRMEPKHILRIMNIFSSLVGEDEKNTFANRLGFDKVIFVSDYENLTSIFHHLYGEATNIAGYINKFYSRKVFEYKGFTYDLYDTVKEILHQRLIDVNGETVLKDFNHIIEMTFSSLFFSTKKINLRVLKSLLEEDSSYQAKLKKARSRMEWGEDFVFVMEFVNIFVRLFEGKASSIKYIKDLNIRNVNQKLLDIFFGRTINSLNYVLFRGVIKSYYTKNNELTKPYTCKQSEDEDEDTEIEFGGIKFIPRNDDINLGSNEKNLELFKVFMLEILNNIYGKVDKK